MSGLSGMWCKVRAIVLRHGVAPQDVDDIVQEAFVRLEAYARRQELRSEEAFLVTTAVNASRDEARRHARSRVHTSEFDLTQISDAAPQPEEQLAIQERLRRVNSGLARLDAKTRRCLLAHRVDGIAFARIAEREDLTLAAVEKRVARAVMFLAQWTDNE